MVFFAWPRNDWQQSTRLLCVQGLRDIWETFAKIGLHLPALVLVYFLMASHVLWCRFRLRLGLFPLGHRCEVASRAKEVQCIECNKCTKFHCHTFSFLIKGGLPSGKISNILAVKLLGCSIYSICYIFFTLPRSKGDWFQNSLPFGAFFDTQFCYWILEEQKGILEAYPARCRRQSYRGHGLNWRWYGTHCGLSFRSFSCREKKTCHFGADLASHEGGKFTLWDPAIANIASWVDRFENGDFP